MIENLWEFIRRYTGQSVIQVLKTEELSADSAVALSEDANYLLTYRRISSTFNGAPIWQAINYPTRFLVLANVPVRITTGNTVTVDGITSRFLITTPDPQGTTTQPIWKMTTAESVAAIQDGYRSTDLYRGWDIPLQFTPDYVIGAIPGGECPVPGLFFRTLSINPDGGEVTLNQRVSLAPVRDCETSYPGSVPLPVGSLADMMDLMTQAEALCTADGKTMASLVITYINDGPTFFASAYSCCEGA